MVHKCPAYPTITQCGDQIWWWAYLWVWGIPPTTPPNAFTLANLHSCWAYWSLNELKKMSAMVSSKLDHRSFPPFYNNLELLLLLLLACTHDKMMTMKRRWETPHSSWADIKEKIQGAMRPPIVDVNQLKFKL